MKQINAYVGFNGKCREAMTFYKECIGGELTFQTIGETPFANQCPEGMHNQIMHGSLTKGEAMLMGSDMIGPGGYVQGTNIALTIDCSSEEEIKTIFNKLAEGGRIDDDLKPQFWGGIFGALTDKFGIKWMLNYEKEKN